MVKRRLLTPDFLRSLAAPESGEYWVSDTAIRGFGVRVWSSSGTTQFCYALRKTDKSGKSVRRSFNLTDAWRAAYSKGNYWTGEEARALHSRDLPDFLSEARQWARLEIAKLTGRIESDEEVERAHAEEQEARRRTSEYVANLTLDHCVNTVCDRGNYRGWSDDERDRLLRAFVTFDRTARCGKYKMSELADGRLIELVEQSDIGPGTLRSLRRLLKVIAYNVMALGGPTVAETLERGLHGISTNKEARLKPLHEKSNEDFANLFTSLRASSHDWRATLSIELAFYFHTPFSRILRGRWQEIANGRWYPHDPAQRKYRKGRYERVEGSALQCLELARARAAAEQIQSDFWFPSAQSANQHIRNVDRVWRAHLETIGWPTVTLGDALSYHRTTFWYLWLTSAHR